MADKQTGTGARGKQDKAKGQKSKTGPETRAEGRSKQVKDTNRSSAKNDRTANSGRTGS